MKTILFATLSLMFALQSCAQKQSAAPAASSYKNKVVLGAFNDMVTASSYNEVALLSLPDEVNLIDGMTSVKNQGQRGTCTFFAATALVESALKMDRGIDANLSEEYMIYSTKKQGNYSDIEASHVSVNLSSMKRGGILLERDWSYIPPMFKPGMPCEGLDNESDETPIECFVHTPSDDVLAKVIPASSIKTGFIRKNTNDIIKFLANNRRPLTISLPVNFRGWSDSGDVIYTEEMRQECLQNSKECGAHSVVLVGYNRAEQVFYFKNSWGDDWGHSGYGKLSFDMVDKYVDGYLYYAKVEGELVMPENYKEDKIDLKNLSIESSLTDDLTVDINMKNTNASGRYMEIQNFVAIKYTDVYGDDNLEAIRIPLEEQNQFKLSYYLYTLVDTLRMDLSLEGPSSHAIIPARVFQYPEVKEMIGRPDSQLVVATGVFLYSDSSEHPVRIFEKNTPVAR